jgi:hypothetical protein
MVPHFGIHKTGRVAAKSVQNPLQKAMAVRKNAFIAVFVKSVL